MMKIRTRCKRKENADGVDREEDLVTSRAEKIQNGAEQLEKMQKIRNNRKIERYDLVAVMMTKKPPVEGADAGVGEEVDAAAVRPMIRDARPRPMNPLIPF